MSVELRQWYAGVAMQGFISTFESDMNYSDVNHDDMAKFAFKQADAMLRCEARAAVLEELAKDE